MSEKSHQSQNAYRPPEEQPEIWDRDFTGGDVEPGLDQYSGVQQDMQEHTPEPEAVFLSEPSLPDGKQSAVDWMENWEKKQKKTQ